MTTAQLCTDLSETQQSKHAYIAVIELDVHTDLAH